MCGHSFIVFLRYSILIAEVLFMDFRNDLLPFPIPELKSRNMRVGEEGVLKRSFSVVPDEFFRLYQKETLTLQVEFQKYYSDAKVMLHTNIDCPRSEWKDLEFERKGYGIFVLNYVVTRCGSYQFKVKYSLDGGTSWFWDRVPFSHVIVDPEAARDIRMYTLIPTVSGSIQDWSEMLPRIAELGFNAVHLLPITSLDLSESPYSAHDLFSIDRAYLGNTDRASFATFEKFVEKAKKEGIRLCFDLTLNHIGFKSKMVRMCPEWIVPDKSEPDGFKRAGCWHMNTWLKWGDLVKIYYDHPHPQIRQDIWDYMTKYSLFWAHFAYLTGGMVRIDNLHSSNEEFITHLLTVLRNTYPDLIVMAEFFTDTNTVIKKAAEWQINLFLANQWEYPYAGDLRNYLKYIHDMGRKVRYYLPITTHDTGVPAQLFGKAEAAVPRYTVTALMGTGQTGIVQGVEHGIPEKIQFIGRKKKYLFPENRWIAGGIQRVNMIQSESSVFHRSGNIAFVDGGHGAVLGCFRWPEHGMDGSYLVFSNLDIHCGYTLRTDLSPYIPHASVVTMEDRVTGESRRSAIGDIYINVEPCGIKILRIGIE